MRNLIIVGLLFSLNTVVLAQRKCDIKAELLMPDSGYTFASIAYDSIPFKLTNLGPDEIYASDVYSVGLYMQGLHYVIGADKFKVTLGVGDSILLFQRIKVLYKESVQDINFCINRCFAYTPTTKVDTVIWEREGDPTYENNLDCIVADVRYTLGFKTSSVYFEQDIFYPNPAKHSIRVNRNFINSKYEITTLSGQIVKFGMASKNDDISLSGLESGVYIIAFKQSDGTVILSKLIKQ
jgi:hypothetical protein